MSTSENVIPGPGQSRAEEDLGTQAEHERQKHLLLDKIDNAELNRHMLDPMIRTTRWFWILFVILGGAVTMMYITWGVQMWWGLGITGLNRPVMWALYIVNFVYFIGIGHAGTFISAALRVLKVEWRRPISRAAEFVTIFALLMAAQFPVIHLGRSWKAYWLIPYPNQRQLWPSFHSPLLWDLMAITTYLTGSIMFAYTGLIPDLAMARDHTTGWRHRFYAILSLGWHGTERQWSMHETVLNIFSYVIIPVMFSVHTVVSWDFAMAIQPGWHSTIFGPYFVIGALFSGSGAVIIALILIRKFMHLEYFLRKEHFAGMGMFLFLLSLAWDYFYFNDYIVTWYGNTPVDKVVFSILARGWASPIWFTMLICNTLIPGLTLWSRRVRTNLPAMFVISALVQVGMYIERYVIVPLSLGYNELPYSWGRYIPQIPESYISFGAFLFVIFTYAISTRLVPIVPVFEVKEGQLLHSLKRIGRAVFQVKAETEE